MEIILVSALVIFAIVQQLFFMNQIQKLVDKVMSRSYTEYIRADAPKTKVQVEQEPPEDLRPLQEFSMHL